MDLDPGHGGPCSAQAGAALGTRRGADKYGKRKPERKGSQRGRRPDGHMGQGAGAAVREGAEGSTGYTPELRVRGSPGGSCVWLVAGHSGGAC